jgi:hypothetical protein
VAAGHHRQSSGGCRAARSLTSPHHERPDTQFRHPPALATAVDHDPRWQNPPRGLASMPKLRMGPAAPEPRR